MGLVCPAYFLARGRPRLQFRRPRQRSDHTQCGEPWRTGGPDGQEVKTFTKSYKRLQINYTTYKNQTRLQKTYKQHKKQQTAKSYKSIWTSTKHEKATKNYKQSTKNYEHLKTTTK